MQRLLLIVVACVSLAKCGNELVYPLEVRTIQHSNPQSQPKTKSATEIIIGSCPWSPDERTHPQSRIVHREKHETIWFLPGKPPNPLPNQQGAKSEGISNQKSRGTSIVGPINNRALPDAKSTFRHGGSPPANTKTNWFGSSSLNPSSPVGPRRHSAQQLNQPFHSPVGLLTSNQSQMVMYHNNFPILRVYLIPHYLCPFTNPIKSNNFRVNPSLT
jgi:hypothetical protein